MTYLLLNYGLHTFDKRKITTTPTTCVNKLFWVDTCMYYKHA